MKKNSLILIALSLHCMAFAQKADSIYFNLYTDSLKKGTYNYINVEGKLANGNILPLDTTQLLFSASSGQFHGNSLWLPFETTVEKIDITVKSRFNALQVLRRTIYIKKKQDSDNLKTVDEIMAEPPPRSKKRK